jgi:hypothetical protein
MTTSTIFTTDTALDRFVQGNGRADQSLVRRFASQPPLLFVCANGAAVNQPRASEAPPWVRRPRKHIAP